jgi:phosphoglycolate phosphatase
MIRNTSFFKAVIFDLDGTLINSLQDIADSMNRALAEKGFPTHDYDSYRYFVGRGLRALVERALPEEQRIEENILELYADLLKDYGENCLNKTKLYHGIPELLDALKEKELKLAILSNKADALTKKITDELMSQWSFDVISGTKGEIPRKPDPAGAFLIMEAIGVLPEEVLYVGDTSVDMKTAIAAGMFPAGVTWGFRTKEELMENGAKAIVDKPKELLNLL